MSKVLNFSVIKVDPLLSILRQVGESPLRPMGDPQLTSAIQSMNQVLQNTTNDTIMTFAETCDKKVITLMKVYVHLLHLFHLGNPSLILDASLRMVELTLNYGTCPASAMAFVYYGERQVALGNYDLAIRLGEFIH